MDLKRPIRGIILVLILIPILLACAPTEAPKPTVPLQAAAQMPEDEPTLTPVPAVPTSTRQAASSASTLQATATPEPISTPTPKLGPSPTAEVACDGQLTSAQTEGPFYTPGSPERTSLIEPDTGGTPLVVTGRILTVDCEPVAGARLDFWQTDANGEYDNSGYRLRGHQFTDSDGFYRLETILPNRYPGRTPHIHVKVFAPDGPEMLTTQIYIPGISEQIPDGIFQPDLLAQNLEPTAEGWQQLGFDFIVAY